MSRQSTEIKLQLRPITAASFVSIRVAGLLTVASILLAFLLLSSIAPCAPLQSGVSTGKPSFFALYDGRQTKRLDTGVHGELHCRLTDKEIDIQWTYEVGDETVYTDQTIAVRFWPTGACFLENDRILIAGKADAGDTILELWTVHYPPISPPQLLLETGELKHSSYEIRITRKAVIYAGAIVGRDIARHLMPVGGKPNCAFLQFQDSKDLYEIDVETRALTRVLTPTAGSEVAYAPELANAWDSSSFGLHKIHGYVYFLEVFDETAPKTFSFVMIDRDRDGVLDEWYQFASHEQREAQGFDGIDGYEWRDYKW